MGCKNLVAAWAPVGIAILMAHSLRAPVVVMKVEEEEFGSSVQEVFLNGSFEAWSWR